MSVCLNCYAGNSWKVRFSVLANLLKPISLSSMFDFISHLFVTLDSLALRGLNEAKKNSLLTFCKRVLTIIGFLFNVKMFCQKLNFLTETPQDQIFFSEIFELVENIRKQTLKPKSIRSNKDYKRSL